MKEEEDDDSGVDTYYTSDMESVDSSNYFFRMKGDRRSETLRDIFLIADIMESSAIRIRFLMTMSKSIVWTIYNSPSTLIMDV